MLNSNERYVPPTHVGWLGWVLIAVLVASTGVSAQSDVTVQDIRLEGLQRIAVGTVFNALPIQIGDRFISLDSPAAIRKLYATGFFDTVELLRDGSTLVVRVVERPAISDIKFEGNQDVDSDSLKDALKQIGLAKGNTFNRASLDKVQQELQRQYFNRGKYSVRIQSEVKDIERNRVEINIKIDEGAVARIVQINTIGNAVFPDSVLASRMQLGPRGAFGLFSSSDQYSRQKLSGDLETLKSYYLDRGYINFNVSSTQISLTPDKQQVYVTINVSEGEKFTVQDVKLSGDMVVDAAILEALIKVKPGDVFSRRDVMESANSINDRIGKEGYAFANINPVPDINNDTREVKLTFYVNPGRRVYVRRINYAGNLRTEDEVLRREMRQMEGAWIATDKVNRSRVRLQRLGFFDEVNVETPPVPGVEDQVDINYSVTERSAGTLQAGLGYSESQGLLFTASVSHNNFIGTGKKISAEVNNSSYNTVYSASYTEPYYTLDGVSRGFRGFFRETDSAGQRNTADYDSDSYGVGMDFGFPLSEENRATIGFSFEHTKIKTTEETPAPYVDFLERNIDDLNHRIVFKEPITDPPEEVKRLAAADFDTIKMTTGWSYDSRNRAIFPDSGVFHSLSGEFSLPGGGLTFYKATWESRFYRSIVTDYTLLLRGQVGWGDGYGDTSELPFFEYYFAGGGRTVRGFQSNTLGPHDPVSNEALGGAFKVIGNAEVIFPIPFAPESKSVRLSYFVDTGNVYPHQDDFDTEELRVSTGLSMVWLSPIGPMVFSLARPLRDKSGDETESFQFSLGTGL